MIVSQRRALPVLVLSILGLVSGCGRTAPSARPFEPVEYRAAKANDIPTAVAPAPDGSVWFSIDFSDAIGRIADGRMERLPKGKENVEPMGIAAASDGSAWFTDAPQREIGHISRNGDISRVPLDTPIARLGRLAVSPDGSVWFAESSHNSITRYAGGKLERHEIDPIRGAPFGVAVDASGNAWATLQIGNKLLRVPPGGPIEEHELPTPSSSPSDVAVGADGSVWVVEFRSNAIARFKDGRFEEFKVEGDRSGLAGLCVGRDGSVWFGLLREHALGRLRSGSVTKFEFSRKDARPASVAADPAGNVWYADIGGWVGMLPAKTAEAP